MNNREGEHQRAVYQMHTGYLPLAALRYPSIGSIVASEIGPRDFDLPSFVSVGNRVGTIGSGFLGMAHAPFVVGDPNRMPANLERPGFVHSRDSPGASISFVDLNQCTAQSDLSRSDRK